MMNAAKLVVDVVLDEETISEIAMLRAIRLEHYEKMAHNPHDALALLKQAGLKEDSTAAQVAANALTKVQQLKSRLSEPNVIYEDELTMYVHTLSVDESGS
jgi:hypothetical protein